MPAPGIGQPDLPGILQFNITNVTIQEPGLPPTAVIDAGTSFTISTFITATGSLNGLLVGDVLEVAHHIEEVQTGVRQILDGGTVTVPPPPPPAIDINFPRVSGPFTTADTGGAANLVIPAGFASGTFRVLTHIHHTNPAKQGIVAAFHDGLIIMLIKP